MAHKEFLVPESTVDPPSFSVLDETFVCLPEPPAGTLVDLIAAAEGTPIAQATATTGFLSGVLSDEDAARFTRLIHAKDTVVPTETLAAILEWVIEQYTDRPTTPSSSSPAGPPPTPATSEDGSDSPASTPLAAIS